jgi:hypothetical protein
MIRRGSRAQQLPALDHKPVLKRRKTGIYANPTTDQLRQRMENLALNAYGDG